MTSLRLLIADDHIIMREGVTLILNKVPDLEVIGQAANGREAVAMTLELQPDIALLDVNMPEMDGVTAAKEIHESCPDVKTLILTMHDNDEIFFNALRAGAAGYVLKGSSSAELIEAVKTVMDGNMYFSPPMTRKLVNALLSPATRQETTRLNGITPREMEILQLLANGLTNREIAAHFVISPSTVQTHRTHIMEKLNLNNRAELVRYAISHKLIKP
ncbi:MAG: response regulator [Anaerolineae bacterium]